LGSLLRSKLRIQQLHMLLLLDRHGSVHHVASLMGLTQPAITKSLKEVESLVGVPLFSRGSGGLRSTPYCHPVLMAARESLLELDIAMAAIREMRGEVTDTISMAAVGPRALRLLVEVTGVVGLEHPELRIRLTCVQADTLMSGFSEGRLDIAVSPMPIDYSRRGRFEAVPLRPQGREAVVVVRHGHPLDGHDDVDAVSLLKYTWVLPPSPDPIRRGVDAALASINRTMPRVIEASQPEVTWQLLSSADVVAVVDTAFLDDPARSARLRILRHPLALGEVAPLFLFTRTGGADRPTLRVVSGLVAAHCC